ncbi:MAG: VOC family protein [Sphingopyxis sp.]
MFSHITIGVADLDRAGAFYDALLSPLGLVRRAVTPDGGPPSMCWALARGGLPRFYAYIPYDGGTASAGNGAMTAFLAPSQAAVTEAYTAGIAAGGSDDGAPGERAHYATGYYGAYLRDPDGNKVHIVHRGDLMQ